MILHPHPQGGGTMNEQITQKLYKDFVDRGFATLRFNFRGVGRSQGSFDNGIGELSDAASALDWVQQIHPEAQVTWVAGVSFGALIGMQLAHAPPGNPRLPFHRCAGKHVRFQLPCALAPPAASSSTVHRTRWYSPMPCRSWSTNCARKSTSPSITKKSRARTTSSRTSRTELMAAVDNYLDFRLDPACPIT